MNQHVILSGWRPRLNKVALTKTLQDQANYSLAEAKQSVDRLLEGEEVAVEFSDQDSAEVFERQAVSVGAMVKVGSVK